MKSARADELRLILPLLLRLATDDFFGTDAFVVLVDDDREEWEDDRPLFWATTVNGRTSMTVASATPVRLSISNLLSCPDYRRVRTMRQGKLGHSDW